MVLRQDTEQTFIDAPPLAKEKMIADHIGQTHPTAPRRGPQIKFQLLQKMHVGQILEHVGVIDGGSPVRDFHAPPAFERRERHEQIGNAIALVS